MIRALLLGLEDEVIDTINLPRFIDPVLVAQHERPTADESTHKQLPPPHEYHYDAKETDLARLLHGPDVVVYRRQP